MSFYRARFFCPRKKVEIGLIIIPSFYVKLVLDFSKGDIPEAGLYQSPMNIKTKNKTPKSGIRLMTASEAIPTEIVLYISALQVSQFAWSRIRIRKIDNLLSYLTFE